MKYYLLIAAAILSMACGKKHMGKHFKMMDTNSDGKVSKAEFQAGHDKKFMAMDSNKDGFVEKSEKMAFHKNKKKSCESEK